MEIKFTTDRVAKILIGISYVRDNLKKQTLRVTKSQIETGDKKLMLDYLQEQIDECTSMYDFFASVRQQCNEESSVIIQKKPREILQLQDLILDHGQTIST